MGQGRRFGDAASAADRAAQRLRALREDRRLSYDALGAKLVPPVDGSTIRRLELGPRHKDGIKISLPWMYRLADALECHPSDLLPDLPPTMLPLDEREHLERYRELSEPDRDLIDSVIEGRIAAGHAAGGPPPPIGKQRRRRRNPA